MTCELLTENVSVTTTTDDLEYTLLSRGALDWDLTTNNNWLLTECFIKDNIDEIQRISDDLLTLDTRENAHFLDLSQLIQEETAKRIEGDLDLAGVGRSVETIRDNYILIEGLIAADLDILARLDLIEAPDWVVSWRIAEDAVGRREIELDYDDANSLRAEDILVNSTETIKDRLDALRIVRFPGEVFATGVAKNFIHNLGRFVTTSLIDEATGEDVTYYYNTSIVHEIISKNDVTITIEGNRTVEVILVG